MSIDRLMPWGIGVGEKLSTPPGPAPEYVCNLALFNPQGHLVFEF